MYDAFAAQKKLIEALSNIEFGKLGVRIDPTGLQLRASGIHLACELFANFIEELSADADASMSLGRVAERDARAIADVGADLAGQIVNGAERHLEAAE